MDRERSEHTNEVSVRYDVLFIIFIFYNRKNSTSWYIFYTIVNCQSSLHLTGLALLAT